MLFGAVLAVSDYHQSPLKVTSTFLQFQYLFKIIAHTTLTRQYAARNSYSHCDLECMFMVIQIQDIK